MTANERKVAWLVSLSHGFNHGYMTLLPAVLVVVAGDQSLGFFALGAIVNVGYCLFGAGSIPAGIMADRLGAKKMLILGLWGTAIASICVGISPGRWSFALAYSFLGLAASIYHPAGLSLIARHIEKKGRALSMHGISGNLGLSLAPFFASAMVMLFDTWRAAYIVLGVIGAFFALAAHKTVIEGEKDWSKEDVLSVRQSATADGGASSVVSGAESGASDNEPWAPVLSLLVLYCGSILFGFIYRGSLTFFPALFQQEIDFVSASEQPVVVAGFLASAILSLGVVGQWLGGYITDKTKWPEIFHVAIYAVVIPAAYCIGRFTDMKLVAASIAFTLVFYGWQPVQNSLIAYYSSRSSYGKGYGWNFFLIMGMGSLATVIGGYVADRHGVDSVYQLLAGLSVLGLMVSLTALYLRCRFRIAPGSILAPKRSAS